MLTVVIRIKRTVEIREYNRVHKWCERNLVRDHMCFYCGSKPKKTHWSNIDHEYRQIAEEWQEVCPKCHSGFDIAMGYIVIPPHKEKLSRTKKDSELKRAKRQRRIRQEYGLGYKESRRLSLYGWF